LQAATPLDKTVLSGKLSEMEIIQRGKPSEMALSNGASGNKHVAKEKKRLL
jgi:hypothetical protein